MCRSIQRGIIPSVLLALCFLLSSRVFAALPVSVDGQSMPSLAPMLERVTPAVVNIATRSFIQQRENPLMNDPFFRHFFSLPQPQQRRKNQSLGSGVIVDAKNGIIITNHHVIDKADEITVTLTDGRDFKATVIGDDPESDVAVIQIDAPNLVAVNMADSDLLRVGDFVIAIGNPFGLGQTVTSGIVSALGRSGLGIEGYEDFIQTDASINPGNSGGALVNLRGELVGINTAIIAPGGGNVGIGFAIPSNMAGNLKDQLVKFGEVRRGQLGITAQDLTPELMQAFNLSKKRGVVISHVTPNSPADQAGIEPGDVILKINGDPVKNSAALRNEVGLLKIGDQVDLDLLKNGQSKRVSVVIGKRTTQTTAGKLVHKLLDGTTLGALTADLGTDNNRKGILVLDVEQGSYAWSAGIRKGDIIAMANRIRVRSIEELFKATRNSDALLLNIQRGRNAFFLLLR